MSTLPIIGDLHHLVHLRTARDVFNLAIKVVKEKGKVVRLWFGPQLAVSLTDPRDVELILSSNVHLEKPPEYTFFEPWLGDGLLISKGDRWRSHRKMIAPTFHQSILKTFMPTFNKNADQLVNLLRNEVVGQICDIHDYMSGTTVDVLMETVMGAKQSKEDKSSFKYAKAVMDMCTIIHYRIVKFWLRSDFLFKFTQFFKEQTSHLKIIHSLTDQVIKYKKLAYFDRVAHGEESLFAKAVRDTEEELKETSQNNGFTYGSALQDDLDENDAIIGEKKRLAFLDFMIEASHTAGNNLTDLDIREEVNTLMFEGHDTTAAASSFFICMLGAYPEIQEQVFQEINDIFHGSDRPVTFNDTLEMKYLERVLLETLRLYPPVPAIGRYAREDIKLTGKDLAIPKGTRIVILTYLLHQDPDYFPNPDKFDPDNFLPERCAQRHYYSFIPFSAGPRSCVGRKYAVLKLKVLLSAIVRNFKISSVVEPKDFKLQGDIILKRADGFRVILQNRK